MRLYILLSLSVTASACADDQPQEQPVEVTAETKAEEERRLAQYRAERKAPFAHINYPTCKQVWSGEKLSSCGRKVYEVAFNECRKATNGKVGGYIVDQYTGDSWQMRAGSAALPLETRIKRMSPGPHQSISFAYALGDGTDDIETAMCELDENLHIEGMI